MGACRACKSGTFACFKVLKGKSLNENLNQIDAPWPSGKAFMGTHAYIVAPEAAQLLQKYVLPINEQTDFYIQKRCALPRTSYCGTYKEYG
jgi:hypothetical protein